MVVKKYGKKKFYKKKAMALYKRPKRNSPLWEYKNQIVLVKFKVLMGVGAVFGTPTTRGQLALAATYAAGDNPVAWWFQLKDLGKYADIQNAFDCYRIVGVKCAGFPRYNVSQIAYQSGGNPEGWYDAEACMVHAIDYDDAATTISGSNYTCDQLRQWWSAKEVSLYKPFTRYLRPRIAGVVYNGVAPLVAAANTSGKTWLDTNNPDVQYYGMKFALPRINQTNTYLASAIMYDVYATYYIQLKDPRLI